MMFLLERRDKELQCNGPSGRETAIIEIQAQPHPGGEILKNAL